VNSLVKYTLIAAAIGGVVYLVKMAKDEAIAYAGKIAFKIKEFGKPTLKNGQLTVPLVVRITNPTLLMAPIKSVGVKLFFLRNGIYHPFASAPATAPFTIKANESTDVNIFPTVDLEKLKTLLPTGLNFNNLLSTVNNLFTGTNPLIDVKAEVTINIEGYETVQEATQKLYITDFLKNVA